MSDLHEDYEALSVTCLVRRQRPLAALAGDLSPEDEVIALAAVARRQKTPARAIVNGPRQHCNVCVRSVRLIYDRAENHGNTVQYTGTCPACGTRHTVSERKKPQ